MPATTTPRTGITSGATHKLRRAVYDDLARARGVNSVAEQLALMPEISRSTLSRARNGRPVSYAAASHISKGLGTPIVALFEEVQAAA